jgi:hypothetical protein
MNDLPLIATKNGNVLENTLTYRHQWIVNEDFIQFLEFWEDATGDIVKNNVHMYALKGGPAIGGQQAVV